MYYVNFVQNICVKVWLLMNKEQKYDFCVDIAVIFSNVICTALQ